MPLAEYLSPDGGYDGFDVVPKAVDWCLANITPDHPNLRFRHVDVRNPAYNPDGALDPSDFDFPGRPFGQDMVVVKRARA